MRRALLGIFVVGLVMAETAAACAPQTVRQQSERVPVIITGVVVSGPVTPARMRVEAYEKGKGPVEVDVDTGIYDGAAFDEGIAPEPGERWRVYGQWHRGTLVTGLCYGSHEVVTQPQAPVFAFGKAATVAVRSTFAGRPASGGVPRLAAAPGKRTLRVSPSVRDIRLVGARGGVRLTRSKGRWTLRIPAKGRPAGMLVADTGDAFYAVQLRITRSS